MRRHSSALSYATSFSLSQSAVFPTRSTTEIKRVRSESRCGETSQTSDQEGKLSRFNLNGLVLNAL